MVAESGVCPGDDINSINYDLRLVLLFTILNFFVIFLFFKFRVKLSSTVRCGNVIK